jgi:hypothetical protein
MAEIHFFMTVEDTRQFVEFLLERFGGTFFLDESPTPDPPRFSTVEGLMALATASEWPLRFSFVSPLWERHPISTNEIYTNDGRHFWYINQRIGGPAFDFCTTKILTTDAISWIRPGSFTDYPWYIVDKASIEDTSCYATFDRPKQMKEAFEEVKRYMKRAGIRSTWREATVIGPWILSGARAAYDRGVWLRTGEDHYDPRPGK